jgi:hypothetical protein
MSEFTPVAISEPRTIEHATWRSMCLVADKEAVVYLTTFSTIAGIIIFCCYQLTHLKDCHSQNAYIGLLCTIIGILLPSPVMKKH